MRSRWPNARGRSLRLRCGLLALAVSALVVAMPAGASAWTAYVTSYEFVVDESNVTRIDTETGVAGARTITAGDAIGIAISPDGATAYVAGHAPGRITPVDTATGDRGAAIAVGGAPERVAVAPDGSTVYSANVSSDEVTPIDAETGVAGSPIAVGESPRSIAVAPDGATAYAVASGSDDVTPFDTETGVAGPPIEVGDSPRDLAITPDGATVYVANALSDDVTPIDTATGVAGPPIAVGDHPQAVAITPDGATVYVANALSHDVTPIDTASGVAGPAIAVGSQPRGVAITPDGDAAYVASSGGVTPIDTATGVAGAPISVQGTPRDVAIVPGRSPIAAFAAGPATAGGAIVLDASASTDPDGDILRYEWELGDGAAIVTPGPVLRYSYADAGSYEATLEVVDRTGCSARVFTGKTASCEGADSFRAERQVDVSPPRHRLAVSVEGAGRVTGPGIDCGHGGGACGDNRVEGAAVVLTATPAAGARFAGWTGACSGPAACELTLDGDRQATARFVADARPPDTDPRPSDADQRSSNAFAVRRARRAKARGTARLVVRTSGAGVVRLARGKRVRPAIRRATGAGKLSLPVRPTRRAARMLRRRGRVKLAARITFAPVGGEPRTKRRRLTLVRRR